MKDTKQNPNERVDVAIVGGGPSGLALATELKRLGVARVVVLEREKSAGGIPRHCGHYPFGLREYGRLLKGPDYAARNVAEALKHGVEIRTESTVTQLHAGGRLSLTTMKGLATLNAKRVVLCMGARESTRAQRFVGGDRPQGVISTGALQSLVYLKGMCPFLRPVIFGSELVSFSAINTCRHLGMRPAAMVEERDQIVTHKVIQPYAAIRGVPLYIGAQNPKIIGTKSVEALQFTDASGTVQHIEADGIIVSGRFRPEAALLGRGSIAVDFGSGGPVIDQFGKCSDPAYYSAGNLLRPAETSGWCWREGLATAKRIASDLASGGEAEIDTTRLIVTSPEIQFALPQRLTRSNRSGGMTKLQVGLREPVNGVLTARVDDKPIWASPLNARPVRRIQRPLHGILAAIDGRDVKLSIEPKH
jgi:thioredoxin reductase